ncbi:MAG TPA: acylphosphatase [Steroidobacteraceae bacterium]|jgi:acylphosphatase|nr:acylphosphatase [Steroidobacteraceae bacterium]
MRTVSVASPVGRRCTVRGRVQGVYYRASAQQRARLAGIVGHARNLADGSVEVLAYGDHAAIEQFVAWLWQGSSAARVTDVAVESVEIEQAAWPHAFTTS